ncbi:hypothetical protein BRARA_I00692 [Brassica rapa]|uniref:Uncharacterized protein n=1 Tax=Brassica campestris TaxID=3711 RepID=A0A397XRY6_BRACM|nr:hypothetical protein BRARA_I00692 [Brassica rapa]
MKHLILLILVTTTYFRPQEACIKIVLHFITNSVLFHCCSKDNDLSVKNLNFNATPYVIEFHDEIPNVTKWNCLLRQGANMEYYFDVEVYKAGPRLVPRCSQIRVWMTKVDGIYFTRSLDTPSVGTKIMYFLFLFKKKFK